MKVPRVLIIAGSDSGGGAGIQADIKTVTMLGGHAMTAITAITAQNTLGVDAVMPVPTDMVMAQIEAVVRDIGVDVVKIGMIGSAETARALAERLLGFDRSVAVIFDPVMVASSGAALADGRTISAFYRLADAATVITPNAQELNALTGLPVRDVEELSAAAKQLAKRHRAFVMAKGGHLAGDELTDILVDLDGVEQQRWTSPRIDSRNTHGTGCTLASAIAAEWSRPSATDVKVAVARAFVRSAVLNAPRFGTGHGPMGHWGAATGLLNINQVTLPARDYAEAVRFYKDLGLLQIVDSSERYARFECPGGATLSIHVSQDAVVGDAVVYLETAELDDWVGLLESRKKIVFDSPPTDENWGWREARVTDPSGNKLCVYWAGENRRFPPWRISTGK